VPTLAYTLLPDGRKFGQIKLKTGPQKSPEKEYLVEYLATLAKFVAIKSL
jgi:hypothetical protein